MHSRLRLLLALLVCSLAPRAWAQDGIGLVCHTEALAGVRGDSLRAALEQELKVPVQLLSAPSGPTVSVEADGPTAVHVRFLRLEQPSVDRTLDVSARADHATALIALLAANLVRDEASELLAQLGAPAPLPEETPELPPVAAPPAQVAVPAPPPEPDVAPAKPAKPRRPAALGCVPNELRKVPVGVDFLPYLGMSMRDSVNVERRFSFNVLGGITGAVHGAELAGLFNIECRTLCGAQLSGVFNFVAQDVTGVQLSQVNIAGGSLLGAQLGQLNIAGNGVYGAQLGEVNLAGGDVTGAQLGLFNLSGGSHYGAQLGLANVAAHGLTGAQLGLTNVIVGPARGTQLGLVNVSTQRERGVLVGLVNVAQDADAALGLVNVLWNGRAQADVWATDAGLFMLGMEHGARLTHNIYGLGIKPMSGAPAWSAAYGFGFRVLGSQPITVDIDALSYGLMRHDSARRRFDFASIHQLRVPVSFSLLRGVAVFVAPSLSVSVAEQDSSLNGELALYKTTRLTNASSTDWRVRLWPGLSLGLRFF